MMTTMSGKLQLHDDVIYFMADTGLIYRILASPGLDAFCGQNVTVCARHVQPFLIALKSCTLKQGRKRTTAAITVGSADRPMLDLVSGV